MDLLYLSVDLLIRYFLSWPQIDEKNGDVIVLCLHKIFFDMTPAECRPFSEEYFQAFLQHKFVDISTKLLIRKNFMNLRLLVLKSFKRTIMLNDRNDITRNAVRVYIPGEKGILKVSDEKNELRDLMGWPCPLDSTSPYNNYPYQVGYLGMIRESLDPRTHTWSSLKIFNRAYLSLQSNILVYKINSSFLSISQFTTFFVVYRKKTNLQKKN